MTNLLVILAFALQAGALPQGPVRPSAGAKVPPAALTINNASLPDTVFCQLPGLAITAFQMQPYTLPSQRPEKLYSFKKVGFAIPYVPHIAVEEQWSFVPNAWGTVEGSKKPRFLRGVNWKLLDPSAVELRVRYNHVQLRAKKPGTTSVTLVCGKKSQTMDVTLLTLGDKVAK